MKHRIGEECKGRGYGLEDQSPKRFLSKIEQQKKICLIFFSFSALGIKHYLISCRVTQTYDVGSCVYFYFGFNWTSLPETADPLSIYERLEEMARDEILASGGSLSHHHGVGKLRAKWFCGQVSPLGVQLYSATKKQLDPKNIFACGNLVHIPSSSL